MTVGAIVSICFGTWVAATSITLMDRSETIEREAIEASNVNRDIWQLTGALGTLVREASITGSRDARAQYDDLLNKLDVALERATHLVPAAERTSIASKDVDASGKPLSIAGMIQQTWPPHPRF